MKGMSFQSAVEFRVQIQGETWKQGDTVEIQMQVSERAANAISKAGRGYGFVLAEGIDKKIKNKADDAFSILNSNFDASANMLASFVLPNNARISDKAGSCYLLYGFTGADSKSIVDMLGQLRLTIMPHQHIQDLVHLFVNQHRFFQKSFGFGKKQQVEVHLTPPDHKDWAFLQSLYLDLWVSEHSLNAVFQFERQEVDALKAGLSSKKVMRKIERTWDLKPLCHEFNGRLNLDKLEGELSQVVQEYRSQGWLSAV
jgi:hypothetical protein